MPISFTNDAGYAVDVGGADIAITGPDGSVTHVAFPEGNYRGATWWPTTQYDVAGNEDTFCLVYVFERDVIGGGCAAQLYNYSGAKIGQEIWISSQTVGGTRPGIGALSNGDYLAVWQPNTLDGYPLLEDRIGYITARTISADGSKIGDTFVVAAGVPLLEEGVPPTISEIDGQIIIGWSSYSMQFGAIDVNNVENGQSGDISKLVYGTSGNDILYTFGGGDTLYGQGGDDLLDAGANNDKLVGGTGSDSLSGGTGADNLIGGSGGDTLNGGDGADTLYAGNGNDTVDAGAGNDLIVGGDGAGDDAYVGGSGVDTVKYTSAIAGIVVNLVAGTAGSVAAGDAAGIGSDTLSGIENIIAGNFNDRLVGSGGANKIQGMDGNDEINGRGGNDVLTGGAGDDLLVGGAGSDSLNGGLGADVFRFNAALGASNIDTIKGFVVTDDTIQLDDAVFVGIGPLGTLAADAFVTGTAALDSDDRIIFNSATGALLYDADGSGAGAAIQFATISGLTGTLTANDFVII